MIFGRVTFSAAANFATDLEHETAAIFAGEADGREPEPVRRRAADPPARTAARTVYMATRYWERSTADDPRITIEPDIPAGPLVGRLLRRPRSGPPGDPRYAGRAGLRRASRVAILERVNVPDRPAWTSARTAPISSSAAGPS